MSAIPKVTAHFTSALASAIDAGAASFTLSSYTDKVGTSLSGYYGFTIDEGTATEEEFLGTISSGVVTVANGGVDPSNPTTSVTALKFAHGKNAPVIISDYPLVGIIRNILNGEIGFAFPNLISYASALTPINDEDIPTRKFVIDTAGGTPVSINRIVVVGNAGETVAAGNIVYFDETDKEWKKAAATFVQPGTYRLGVAQGAGTDGNAITGGVLLEGLDTNQSGMTAGVLQYLSDTAGARSESAGTLTFEIGFARPTSTTDLYFFPGWKNLLNAAQRIAAAGSNGTLSSTNKYLTQLGLQRGQEVYAATATGNDTYVITLSPVPAALISGMEFRFKADVANTGAATLNVNNLGAISIVKNVSTALNDGDIAAGKVVTVKYDGTNFQLVDVPSPLVNGTTFTDATYHTHTFDKKITNIAQTTLTALTSTPQNILSVSVAGGSLGTANAIEGIVVLSSSQASGDTFHLVSLKYGATTLCQARVNTTDSTTRYGTIQFSLSANGATNAQRGNLVIRNEATGSATAFTALAQTLSLGGTATIDSTSAQTLALTIETNSGSSNGGSAIVQHAAAFLIQ